MRQISKRRATTLIEIMIVLVIIGIVAALVFPTTAGSREAAKQRACMSNLHQIFVAAQLYANDNPGYDTVHPDVDWPQGIVESASVLVPYGAHGDIMYCPDTPSCFPRDRIPSTYVWNGLTAEGRKKFPSWSAELDEKMALTKSMTPVVFCLGHDEAYFYPRERDFDELLNPPYVVDLLANGATRSSRRLEHRGFVFKTGCTIGGIAQ